MDYIKLNRKVLNWEWYGNINTCRLFIHMILKANWKDGKFEGKVIPRGSFVSSLPKLADETSLTMREVRTAISHLKSTGEVTCKTYSKGWMVGKNHMRDWKAAVRTWERNRTKPPNGKKGSFNNFAQNNYDFAALEEELRSN